MSHMKYCSTFCKPSMHIFSPFPEVAEAVQEELEKYRSQEDEVKRLKSAMVSKLKESKLLEPLHKSKINFQQGSLVRMVVDSHDFTIMMDREGVSTKLIAMLSYQQPELCAVDNWRSQL